MPVDVSLQDIYSGVSENPRHQRLVQRLLNMHPDQRAIASTIAADEAFADAEAKKLLDLTKMGADKSFATASLAEKKRQADMEYNLASQKAAMENTIAKDTLSFNKWMTPVAHVVGASGLGIAGFNAWNQAKRAEALSKYLTTNEDVLLKYLGAK